MKSGTFSLRSFLIVFTFFMQVIALRAQGLYDYTVNNGLYYGDMCVAASGNCYLASYNELTCFSPSGAVLWSTGLQQSNLGVVRVFEIAGEIVIAGVINISPNGAFILFKLDANQNLLWTHEYAWSTNMYPLLKDALLTSDGEFILAGGSGNTNYLFKTDASGNVIWVRSNNTTIQFTAIGESDDHHLLIGCGNATVLKMDTAGTVIWQHAYILQGPNPSGSVTGIADAPGGYLFTGNCGVNGIMIVRADSNGNLLYSSSYIDTTSSGSWLIQSYRGTEVTDSGMVIVLSHHQNFSGGDMHGGIAYIDTAGSLRWTREYTTMWSVSGVHPDGSNYVVLGCSELITSRYALMKTNSNGTGLCSGTTIALSHGGYIADTSFNYLLNVSTIPDTQFVLIQPVTDSIVLLGNCGPLGIEAAENIHPLLFPNPCSGFNFSLNSGTMYEELFVYDATGRQVFSKSLQPGETLVTCPKRLEPGIYLVNLQTDAGIICQRLIVEY